MSIFHPVLTVRYKRRHWAVRDRDETLVCVCLYRKGAQEVARRLSVPRERKEILLPERRKEMGGYVAFPTHLVEELLQLLPPDERVVYAERFEPIVGDLVWVRADAENAVEAALREREMWPLSPSRVSEMAAALEDFENESLVRLVQESLQEAAQTLVDARFGAREPASKDG